MLTSPLLLLLSQEEEEGTEAWRGGAFLPTLVMASHLPSAACLPCLKSKRLALSERKKKEKLLGGRQCQ